LTGLSARLWGRRFASDPLVATRCLFEACEPFVILAEAIPFTRRARGCNNTSKFPKARKSDSAQRGKPAMIDWVTACAMNRYAGKQKTRLAGSKWA
jgi:hypothetical protein